MKRKYSRLGFTLIELLAVIVIIIIVLAISIPLISNILETVRKEAFKATAYSISDSGRFLMANDTNIGYEEFYYLDGVQYNADGKKLDYTGDGPKTGVVVLNEKKKVALAIHNGTYCATKSADVNKVTVTKTSAEDCKAYNIINTCDTWEQIALKYDVTLTDLLKANNVIDSKSSTCGLNIKIPLSSTSSNSNTAGGKTVYYKTYYTVGYVGYSENFTTNSYEYTVKLGVLPLNIEDIEVVRVTTQSVFESLDDFKRYITKKNMGEVIWPGDENPPEIDISQASVFKDHALRSDNMTADDVTVMCDTEACYATIEFTVDNMNNINPNYINSNQIAYTPIKFTVEFNGEAEMCAVRTTADAVPGTLAGTGTSADPYLIESIEDLVALSNNVNAGNTYGGKYISLTTSFDFKNKRSYKDFSTTIYGDINGNGTVEGLLTELTTGAGFVPIGNNTTTFSGRLSGNIGCVYNLYINRPTTNYVGFIGYNNGGIIKDLTLNNININGGHYTGGIAGQNQGSILNMTVQGNVTGLDNVGLVSGYMEDSLASSVFVEGNVTGVNNVGGLVGRSRWIPTIKGVFKGGSVVGTGSSIGRSIGSIHYDYNLGVIAMNTITVNGSPVSSLMFNNQHGFDISSMSDLNNINLAELALDTYIGGDNDGDGYYWDYDASYNVVRKSVVDYPLTFSLSGTGTTTDPYLIYNYTDLKQASMKPGSSFKVMSNINLSGEKYYMMGSFFNKYSGTFDGNNKTVSNLNLNNSKVPYTGFFGYINGGTVKEINLTNFDINGGHYTGGMAGQNQGRILDSNISGNVMGIDNVGLVSGYMDDSLANSVFVEGNVTGVNNVGGLVGRSRWTSTIKGVVKGGSVVGTGSSIGRSIGSIHYDYNLGVIAMNTVTVNGSTVSSLMFNNQHGLDISSMSDLNNINLAELALDTYVGGDNDGDGYYWDYDASYNVVRKSVVDYPLTFSLSGTGTTTDPYLIYNYTDLKQASMKPGSSFKLMSDIDMSGKKYYMMGSFFNKYSGTFDGNDKTVSNLNLNNLKVPYTGFFGYINGGIVKGINLINFDIKGGHYTAGMAGQNQGRILNSTISGNVTGLDNVGLLSGYMDDSFASSVFVEGNVTGVNNVGSIVGRSRWTSTIKGVVKGGSVVGTGSSISRSIGSIHYDYNIGVAVMDNVTVNGATVTSSMFNNGHGLNITSMSDLNNINLAELALDTYIGGDNDGDGYYWDYDASYNVVRKSVAEYPLTFSLSGTGTTADPYLIYNYNDLKQASMKPGSSFKLMSDIDMSGEKYYMMGSFFNKYSGTFDGNNKTVNNLSLNNSKGAYTGFFGYLNGGIVKGINLANFDIIGGNFTAGMAGQNQGRILDSTISGNVTGKEYVGLLSGYMDDSFASSFVAEGNVIGVNNVGGLVGGARWVPTIKGIFKSGSVIGTGTANINRSLGYTHYQDNLNTGVLSSITVNGSEVVCTSGEVVVACTNFKSTIGADITSSDLSNTVIYTDRGFNFTDETLDYIWYIDGGVAKFRQGNL